MRFSRLILIFVVTVAVILLADVLAGTLVEMTTSSPESHRIGERQSEGLRSAKRKHYSRSLKDRLHPALQDEVGKGGEGRSAEHPVPTTVAQVATKIEPPPATRDMRPVMRFGTHTHSLISEDTLALLNSPEAAIDLTEQLPKSTNSACDHNSISAIKDSSSSENYARLFTDIFRNDFAPIGMGKDKAERGSFGAGIPWWLDEGGLIGSARAGSMSNADDDFDFFALLPNQTAPCRPDSTTCTNDEFNTYIHRFLMVFWNRGLCINKFNPDVTKFKSNMRLMYSLQFNRDNNVPPEKCFKEHKPFAHMHLGMMVDNSEKGEIETNVWARHTTHPIDKLPLSLILPTTRCRVGAAEAPCPRDIVGFLHLRNRGEYFKKSSDGSCLLIRNKWGRERKVAAATIVENLSACGYNTMVSLVPALRASDFVNC